MNRRNYLLFIFIVAASFAPLFVLWNTTSLYEKVDEPLDYNAPPSLRNLKFNAKDEQDEINTKSYRLERYKQRYHYLPPSPYLSNHTKSTKLMCGTSPDYSTYFSQTIKTRSANREDLDIYKLLFKDHWKNGTKGGVVELGAYNGIQESNSRFFEYCLGWETLLIEGNPRMFKSLVLNRPHAHKFNFAPSCTEQEDLANKTVQFDYVIWLNAGLGATVKTAYTNDTRAKKVDVPCGSLTQVLLDVFPNGHVSFFSLDVEGSEHLVLRNIDFSKVFVETLMVEHYNIFCKRSECESRDQFRKIMHDNGYIRFTQAIKKSDLFIHPLSKHLEDVLKNKKLKEEYERFMLNKNSSKAIPKNFLA
uniref:Methyltransferase FkbM domain-containing protein n=1 Tax=Fibrocapsa japonica TaxID=94617 RepID=A0A7S2UZ89_9STRA|mmetsp:Transcript_18423/g.26783  ORF Transcript_18423/g.26783 Transcript_18423/m.26783 type:complete len:361 (+) Transcript_18423:104-1186(+)|eukprot:CAMPEP_0113936708 /NCGR_PEP_ID=MMETSP1339-20121228/3536_1 /TAXON_ID=94617 /ORGANISM="Fibrocapsa japonica" /LENGTH=360 /DNA_ID=CAMNT_0000939243 /DNA_START=88 /DNA_END=1170 /DNA_ORIENTATION=- /assembly_acc=CAM_ASM_000762